LLYFAYMRTVVAVLRGGPSREYEVSLKTGASVLAALDRDKYEPRDLFISREGVWHLHGVPVDPERALRGTDVAFNALHGEYGEDGQVQRLLDALGVPYTGSGALASSVAFNKQRTKDVAASLGIKVAHGMVVGQPDDLEAFALKLFRSFPHPAIVKPVAGGSSIGTNIADTYQGLRHALEQAFAISPQVLIEEYIPGREATVGVINHFRNEPVYALLPLEIRLPPESRFYDFHAKYHGTPEFVVPATFSRDQKDQLTEAAKKIHAGLELSHYSRSDFIVSKRGIYFLEVETVVDLADDTEFVHMLKAIGTSLSHFADHLVQLAHQKV
jgi:D-alanine-D-alanine ligase